MTVDGVDSVGLRGRGLGHPRHLCLREQGPLGQAAGGVLLLG